MRVLDDEGRLFGWINVIDALVVGVALVLVVGGAFVVLSDLRGGGTTDQEPNPDVEPFRYATVTFDAALGSHAAGLSPGAELASGGETYDVIDVHRSLTANGDAHVTARVGYRGNLDPGGDRVLAGDGVVFSTNDSRFDVDVEAVGLESGTFATTRTPLVVAANSSRPGTTAIGPGDDLRVADDVVGTVEAVDHRPDGRTLVGLTITARETPAGPVYGGTQPRIGSAHGIVTDEVILRGQVVALDTADPDTVT